MKSIAILSILILCSFASFSQDKKSDPFVGLEKKEVIKQYGEPSRVVKNIDGGETLLYVRTRPTTASNQGLSPEETQTYSFTIDKENKVVHWQVPPPAPQGC